MRKYSHIITMATFRLTFIPICFYCMLTLTEMFCVSYYALPRFTFMINSKMIEKVQSKGPNRYQSTELIMLSTHTDNIGQLIILRE